MKINSAEDLAKVLDPGKKMIGWWERYERIKSFSLTYYDTYKRVERATPLYVGPPDLHTSDEYIHLMLDWLWGQQVYNLNFSKDGSLFVDWKRPILVTGATRSTMLVAAIEKIIG